MVVLTLQNFSVNLNPGQLMPTSCQLQELWEVQQEIPDRGREWVRRRERRKRRRKEMKERKREGERKKGEREGMKEGREEGRNFLWFWSLEVKDQGAGRVGFSHSLPLPGLWVAILSLCPHMIISLCVHIPGVRPNFLLQRHWSV